MYPYNSYSQYGPAQYQQYQPQAPAQDERIWVQGQGGADAYLVAPNGFVRLWDATRPVFYEKRADHTGRPSMESFEYKRFDAAVSGAIGANTLGDELTALKSRITALENWRYRDELEQNGNHGAVSEFSEDIPGGSKK